MSRMMDRLNVTATDAPEVQLGFPFREARRTCLSCDHVDECEAWLSLSNAAYAADAPSFCPNARLFQQLRSATRNESGGD